MIQASPSVVTFTRVTADEETLDVRVPTLLLQPLVENAIRYAAAARPGPASIEVRARRRVKQLREKGIEAIESRVLEEMKERDARDGSRAVAPLKPAGDALVIDSTGLDPDEVFHRAVSFIDSKGG